MFLALCLAAAPACRNQLPCPDCNGDDRANGDEDPPSDLPCDSADLMTDPLNCGECGNECYIRFEGSDWEAGGCVEGECAPTWSDCVHLSIANNCDEICTGQGKVCAAGACANHTAAFMPGGLDPICNLDIYPPVATMMGPCDEPWPEDLEEPLNVYCCCGY